VTTAPLLLAPSTSRLRHPLDIAIWRRRLFELYALEADVKAMAPHDANRVMTWWIGKLAGATGAMGDTGLAQFIEEVGCEGPVDGGTHETAWEAALRELAQYPLVR
jgi:hypothetical protein